MSNFGFVQLRVVNPYEVAFREARSAVGAEAMLATAAEFKTVADAVADCTLVVGTTAGGRRHLQQPLLGLTEGVRLIRQRLRFSRVGLLFGSERAGLSNADLSHCQWLMRIPTREEHGSMNLGQAVAICMYELERESKVPAATERIDQATASEIERIAAVLMDALRMSGYLSSRSPSMSPEKLRRLTRRLHFSASDAEVWLGMLRQINWKLRQGS
jgi:tRNA/rRNA methyltransferase